MPAVLCTVGPDPDAALDGIRTDLHRYFGLPLCPVVFEAAGIAEYRAAGATLRAATDVDIARVS
jgi:hypothetical protein